MNFRADMDKAYKNKVVGTQEKRVRATALAILADLTLQTPVGDPTYWKNPNAQPGYTGGRARANWLPSFGSPRTDTVGADASTPTINFSGWRLGTSIFISNNLPYIRRLNDGWSQRQQPTPGWVERAVQVANLIAKSSFGRVL